MGPLARDRRLLVWICVAAVALRLLAVCVLRAWEAPGAMEHAGLARHVVQGYGFSWNAFGHFGPSSIQSPTYPALLAALFLLFGTESSLAYAVALTINCLLAAPVAAGLAAMTRQMGGRGLEPCVAAALFAVWPTQIYAAAHAQAIALITGCVIWMIALFLRCEREQSTGAWVGFSLVAWFASLTEPTLLPITVLSLPWMLLRVRSDRRVQLRTAAILLGVGVLVMGPWTVRNWKVHGTFVLVKSGFWVNVWKGANDYATGTDRLRTDTPRTERADLLSLHEVRGDEEPPHQYEMLTPDQRLELEGKSEIEREKIFRRYATTWIAAHPDRFAELCVARLWKTLWIDTDNPKGDRFVYPVSRAALLLLAVPGLVVAAARRWRLLYAARTLRVLRGGVHADLDGRALRDPPRARADGARCGMDRLARSTIREAPARVGAVHEPVAIHPSHGPLEAVPLAERRANDVSVPRGDRRPRSDVEIVGVLRPAHEQDQTGRVIREGRSELAGPGVEATEALRRLSEIGRVLESDRRAALREEVHEQGSAPPEHRFLR